MPEVQEHQLVLDGPISYPGGKDGFYTGVCACMKWTTGLAPKADVEKSWEQHAGLRP